MNQGTQHGSIGVIHICGRQYLSGFDDASSDEHTMDTRLARDPNECETSRSQSADITGAESSPRDEKRGPAFAMAACFLHLVSRGHRIDDRDDVSIQLGMFYADESIGAERKSFTRLHTYGATCRQASGRRYQTKGKWIIRTGTDGLIGPQGEAVRGDTAKRWEVYWCRKVLGEDPYNAERRARRFVRREPWWRCDGDVARVSGKGGTPVIWRVPDCGSRFPPDCGSDFVSWACSAPPKMAVNAIIDGIAKRTTNVKNTPVSLEDILSPQSIAREKTTGGSKILYSFHLSLLP